MLIDVGNWFHRWGEAWRKGRWVTVSVVMKMAWWEWR